MSLRTEIQEWLPPTRGWLAAEAVILIFGVGLLIGHTILGRPETTEARALTPPPLDAPMKLPPGVRQQLLSTFPAQPASALQLTSLFEKFSTRVTEVGLSLDYQEMEPALLPNFPPRRIIRVRVAGEPTDHARLLRYLRDLPAPVRVVGLDWSEGGGPGRRLLQISVEVFVTTGENSPRSLK